ncbi:tRNA 2-selenouridine(34) synthase MnmH [Persicirhabdus sediminis]|uniref:tRNA 2-selenouridine(34) synthase MnmH n=1 Tax=Persicirhabdus sediminis TaxID=454144 RepID=A0A8J7MF58_9BACT|nr:tRNA 2-selenouridine(34) synthase MnmH [Persicirhabdus sediminis]MBK1791566.1 tRNA 2-selenouridine(34) synthase MnmH [Persicirhabdus sediminis]
MIPVASITLPSSLTEFDEIIDVRSPAEFAEDHIPGAINLPCLTNEQRAEVGTLDRKSAFEARRLGAALVTENMSRHLRTHFADKAKNYTPLIYCWRGGMRSRSCAFILCSIGWRARVIDRGYQHYRNFVIDQIEQFFDQGNVQLRVLSGLTGIGKTRLLYALEAAGEQVLDLEQLANHRGSTLGSSPDSSQPSQKYFESQLLDTLSKFDLSRPIYTESESNRIGKIHCPPSLWRQMKISQVVEITLPIEERASLLLTDYHHFVEHPETLYPLLDKLVPLRGHAKVEQWKQLIKEGKWREFVLSNLRDHYDLCYRVPGHEKSNYPAASHTVALTDHSPAAIEKAIAELTALPTQLHENATH